MTTELEQIDLTNKETVVKELKPVYLYQTYPLEKGQYWVRGNELIAFILDINEFAIIFQSTIGVSESGEPVFDLEAGQDMVSIDRFRTHLTQSKAELAKPDPVLARLTIDTYRQKLDKGEIHKPQQLPRTQEDANEFYDYEDFTVVRSIIPPPRKFRDRRGFHWLKAGLAGNHTVLKCWDPKVKNWVLQDGTIDLSAKIGFITGYAGEAMVFADETSGETFEQLSERLIAFLRNNGFFFDDKFLKKELDTYNPKHAYPLVDGQLIDRNSYIKSNQNNVSESGEGITFPIYQFAFYLLADKEGKTDDLLVSLIHDSRIVHEFVCRDIQNREYIPNNKTILFTH